MTYLVWGILCSLFALRAFAGEPVYTVDCNGGGDFRTVQECFDALPPKPDGWRTVRILPGMRSPTVLPLAQEGWCSIHAVIDKSQLWERIERLKEIGAEGILILALENMIR